MLSIFHEFSFAKSTEMSLLKGCHNSDGSVKIFLALIEFEMNYIFKNLSKATGVQSPFIIKVFLEIYMFCLKFNRKTNTD